MPRKKVESPEVPVEQRLIAGISVAQWDTKWTRQDGGFGKLYTELNHKVGLYRADLNGCIVAIGLASESQNGGLRKRLADFRRPGSSGREHSMGRRIHDNIERLDLHVLCTGSDWKGADVAAQLKKAMVEMHKPAWNVRQSLVTKAIIRSKAERVKK